MNIVLPFLAKFTRPIYKTSSLPPLFHHQQAQLVKPASSSVIDRVNRDQEHMVRWIRLGWLFEVDVVVAPSVAAATLVWQQLIAVTTSIPKPSTHQSVMLEDTKKRRERKKASEWKSVCVCVCVGVRLSRWACACVSLSVSVHRCVSVWGREKERERNDGKADADKNALTVESESGLVEETLDFYPIQNFCNPIFYTEE